MKQQTLRDICELIVDCEHKTAPTQETGYPSIRTPNVGRGRLILNGVNRVSEEVYLAWAKRATPKAGDIILAREAPLGNAAIIVEGQVVCLGQRTVLIRPDTKKVNPDYLVYYLLGDEVQGRFHSNGAGATVPHLNMSDIRGLPIPQLPVREVQDRIAAILSAYDDLTENNSRRIQILEQMAHDLYEEWFIHFRFPGHETERYSLDNLPANWSIKSLGEIAQQHRKSVDPSEVPPNTPYVGLEHIPRKSIALTDWGNASEVNSTKLVFERGSILFGKIRPYFHKVAVAPIDGVASSDAIVISPHDPQYFATVLLVVSSENFVAHATQTSQGTKMPRANWDILVKYPVVIPDDVLLQRFNEMVGFIVDQIQNLLHRNRNLKATRDLLLPRLISGELDVSTLEIQVEELETMEV